MYESIEMKEIIPIKNQNESGILAVLVMANIQEKTASDQHQFNDTDDPCEVRLHQTLHQV